MEMGEGRVWPSRRLQLATIAVLALGSALRVFWQPLSREDRAEKLYLDSWFVGRWNLFTSEERHGREEAAIKRLEAALKLRPGDNLYEQALVWQYPRRKLPELLRKAKLGPEARRLAAGLLFEHEGQTGSSRYSEAELRRLDILAKADPTNALVHYRRAFVFQRMGRLDEACCELRPANRLRMIRFYYPDVSMPVLDSLSSPRSAYGSFDDAPGFRNLARAIDDAAEDRLRERKANEACRMLEDSCRMGVNVASAEPRTIINVLVGRAVFAVAWMKLEPIYKDFGMNNRLTALHQVDDSFERMVHLCATEIDQSRFEDGIARAFVMPVTLTIAGGLGICLGVLALLWWTPAVIVRKRRRESTLMPHPWKEGWLARMLLAIYIPFLVIALAIAFLQPTLVFPPFSCGLESIQPAVVGLTFLAQLAVVGVTLQILHRRFDEHHGERTGFLRFVFKSPAAVKVWTRKYLIAAFGAQVILLVCCFLAATILYKPIVGGHPWEASRFEIAGFSHEEAFVSRITEDLKSSNLTLPHIGGRSTDGSAND